MKSQRIERIAAKNLLETFEDTDLDWLQAFTMPTLVVCGSEDHDNGSAEELAEELEEMELDDDDMPLEVDEALRAAESEVVEANVNIAQASREVQLKD